jgi:2-polyprenyl-3-methyl-5-hydroxy-6-metoxy-1,4-benzoquinol methylase
MKYPRYLKNVMAIISRNKKDIKKRQIEILSATVDRYISLLIRGDDGSASICDSYQSIEGTRHFGFIPSHTQRILDTLYRLSLYVGSKYRRQYRFLDIGCGIGNIVLLASMVGFNAYGLEYNEKIYSMAKRMMGPHRIFKGDMNKFTEYNQYDILYYYQPICQNKTMLEFAKKLAKVMKCGAYVIPNGTDIPFTESNRFEKIELCQHSCHSVFRRL